jgi:hypothetical protein
MARSNLSALAWSMEDEDIIAEIAEEGGEGAGAGEDLAGDNTVEAATTEMAEATGDVAEVNDDIDDLVVDADNLEAVQDTMESFKARGGMTKDLALMSQVAIENIISKYPGLTLRGIGIPSVESFGDAGQRLTQTTVSCEGIRQLLSDFWAMIMKQVNKLTAYVRNWYLKVLDAAPRLKKRAEAIGNRAEDTTGTIENKQIEIGLLRDLSLNGKAATGAQVLSALETIKAGNAAALEAKSAESYESTMNALLDILEKAVDGKLESLSTESRVASLEAGAKPGAAGATGAGTGGTVGGAPAKSYKDKLVESLKGSAKGYACSNSLPGDDKRFDVARTTALASNEILGNKAVIFRQPGSASTTVKAISKNSGLSVDTLNMKQKALESTGTFETLATSQVKSIADVVAEICETIIAYKKAWDGREKQQKRMDAEVKKAINSSEKASDENGNTTSKVVRECADAISTGWRTGVQFESQLINYSIKTGRAALSYCERSLSEHKK